MRTYSEILRSAIRESGLRSEKILSELEAMTGLRPTPEYLSRLKNGKGSPASDKLNIALAKVLNIDPDELLAAAYREKVPPNVLKRMLKDLSKNQQPIEIGVRQI